MYRDAIDSQLACSKSRAQISDWIGSILAQLVTPLPAWSHMEVQALKKSWFTARDVLIYRSWKVPPGQGGTFYELNGNILEIFTIRQFTAREKCLRGAEALSTT